MRQKSNFIPAASLSVTSGGQFGSATPLNRRSALRSMACAARTQLPSFAGASASPGSICHS